MVISFFKYTGEYLHIWLPVKLLSAIVKNRNHPHICAHKHELEGNTENNIYCSGVTLWVKLSFLPFSSLNFLISLVVFAMRFCVCFSLFSKVSLIFLIVRREMQVFTQRELSNTWRNILKICLNTPRFLNIQNI